MNVLMLLAFVTTLFGLVQSVPANKVQTRVYGGKPAKRKDFPYLVRLLLKRRQSSEIGEYCSGGLISESHILTAAHCFYPHGPMGEVLTAGEAVIGSLRKYSPYDANAVLRVINTGDIFIHNGFPSLQQNDIAIIILQRPVTLKTGVIEPIRLPRLNQDLSVGDIVTVAGYGLTHDKTPTDTEFLLYTRLKIQPDEVCRIIGFEPGKETCAKGNNTSTCAGDSGSPVTIMEDDGIKTILGVVSGGSAHCEDLKPETMANVHYHLTWIYQKTGLPIRH